MSTVPAPNAHGYTEEDLAMLTEAERAGLLDPTITDDYVEDEKDAADPASGTDAGTPAETDGDDTEDDPDIIEDDFLEGDNEEEAQAAIDAAAAEAAAKAAADAASGNTDPAPGADPAPAANAADPRDGLPEPLPFPNVEATKAAVAAADKKVADLDTKITDLESKYDDGELELTEAQYREQLKQLRADQIAATREAGKLENAVADAEAKLNNSLTTWSQQIVPGFLSDKPEMFRNRNSIAFKVMEEHVRAEQAKSGVPFDAKHLQNAYAATVKQMQDEGLMPKTAPAQAKTEDKPKDQAKRPSPPPTLGAIPASEVENATGGDPVFENLNKLAMSNPAKFEQALANLTDAQRERYLLES